MVQDAVNENIVEKISQAKDLNGKQFKVFSNNFYLIKAALRYYTEDVGMSFTATKISDDFPLNVFSAGSCLSMLDKLDVIEPRTNSKSASRYMPRSLDKERLIAVEKVLEDNLEIKPF